MQIGYILTATNVQTIAISNIWALVEYTDPGGKILPRNILRPRPFAPGIAR